MVLSEIQSLPANEKCLWLQSPQGLEQLQKWLSEGLSLRKIAQTLQIDGDTIYNWRYRYATVSEVMAHYVPVRAVKVAPVDLSRGAAYRIICAFEDHKTYLSGRILFEFKTANDVWDSLFIQRYFDSYSVEKCGYLNTYLEAIKCGVFKMSSYYCITYGYVTKKGLIRFKPTA